MEKSAVSSLAPGKLNFNTFMEAHAQPMPADSPYPKGGELWSPYGVSSSTLKSLLVSHVSHLRSLPPQSTPFHPPPLHLDLLLAELNDGEDPNRFVWLASPGASSAPKSASKDLILPPAVVLCVLSRYRAFLSPSDMSDYLASFNDPPPPSSLSFLVPAALFLMFLLSAVFGLYAFLLVTTHDLSAGDEGEYTKRYIAFVNGIIARVVSLGGSSDLDSEGQCVTAY
mmetsp:Transcript_11701/g.23289  ORF Transcript_11701/g.23289 Transcript_11701/m.23289 type:complete len:226 (-) Transcript_11701:32-709(-)